MPNMMVALPNTGGALCSTPQRASASMGESHVSLLEYDIHHRI